MLKSYRLELVGFILVGVFLFCAPMVFLKEQKFGSFGTNDFIEYYSAYKLYINNQDLYDPQQLLPIQQAIGRTQAQPLMMWNPPWTLALLSPILKLDFALAAQVFLGLNLLLVFLSSLLARDIFTKSYPQQSPLASWAAVAYGFFSVPIFLVLKLGQISILLTFFVTLLFWALESRNERNQKDWLAGATIALLSLKPHLVFLLLIALGVFIYKRRRWRIAGGALLGIGGLLAVQTLQAPYALCFYMMKGHHGTDPLLVPVESWQGSTLVGFVRGLLFNLTGHYPALPMLLIPGVSAAITFWYFAVRARDFNWISQFLPLLALSLFTAPFGWSFDHSILLLGQIGILICAASHQGRPRLALWLVILLQGTSALVLGVWFRDYLYLFWYPVAFLGIWVMAMRDAAKNPYCPS